MIQSHPSRAVGRMLGGATLCATLCATVIGAIGACQRPSAGAATAPAAPPRIERILPNPLVMHAGALAELEIVGRGFAQDSNTVTLGPYRLDGLPSTSGGTRIRLIVPERMPSVGGMAPPLWVTGAYPLVVETRHGRSDSARVMIQETR